MTEEEKQTILNLINSYGEAKELGQHLGASSILFMVNQELNKFVKEARNTNV